MKLKNCKNCSKPSVVAENLCEACLTKKYYDKLKDNGFNDIENDKGELKTYDRRTINWDNRDMLFDFFTKLDHYLTYEGDKLPQRDREILTHWTEGLLPLDGDEGIAATVGVSYITVHRTLTKYRKIVMAWEEPYESPLE